MFATSVSGSKADPRSLPEVHESIQTLEGKPWWRRFLAFAGPAFLVSVGYMDPGNWGTDLAGGSRFGYTLLWVIFASNLMAQFLQVLCVKLGLVTGKDLAMACRDYYKRPAAMAMWVLCELAIIATDLAEVVGSAVALNLLFGIDLVVGVVITGFDVLLLLGLMRFGFRKLEAIILTLVATIFGCFAFQLWLARPDWGGVLHGTFVPAIPNAEALLISVGILGATVMPHNLYLHSSVVRTRKTGSSEPELRKAITYNRADTIVALSFAFFVNAAILVLAAAVFGSRGVVVEELQSGQELLRAALGGAAGTAFAVALLASGQSSTLTGTLAGQIVMEGFLQIRIKPWLRRLVTRVLAIVPAIVLISASGGRDTVQLLVISQVVLSMQLPFAIIPLIAVTSDPNRMGPFVNSPFVKWIGYATALLILGLNAYLLYETVGVIWVLLSLIVVGAFAAYVRYVYKERPA
ncbi:MAG TPA: Nramp family divalent metal transporter [Fimbriimonadaceae bacterium]|nr:Nramp family divalent metal transporter [Fimbriimonadaceae bacterium]